jgi:hypothetical protein
MIKKITFLLIIVVFISCSKDSLIRNESGSIKIDFVANAGGVELIKDTLLYKNEAGNEFMVNQLQYFISHITLYQKGNAYRTDSIHYVDIDIPSTLSLQLSHAFKVGSYDSLVFTFGLDSADNQSNRFANPPERDMFWPDVLGGGYHYMKLNIKWLDTETQTLKPVMNHLGKGQVYASGSTDPSQITGFIHNNFRIALPLNGLKINPGTQTNLQLVMNVQNWFYGAHNIDFRSFGPGIMQSQDAMKQLCDNGAMGVFSVEHE